MKRRFLSSALAFVLASASLLGSGAYLAAHANLTAAQAKEKQADEKESVQSVQKFGYDLMEQYLTEKNPVMSPVSAYVMLSMVGNGAKGTTKKEFEKVLGSDMLSVSENLMNTLPQGKDGMKLTIANSAWLDDEFTPKKNWLDTAKKQFSSDVFQEDLGTTAAKNKINKWVSERTNKLIPKLLEKKLDKETRLALVNALYFQADWEQQFVPERTFEGDFSLDNGKTAKTDMMHAKNYQCGYMKDDASEGVILPYKDSSFAFAAIKPSGDESIRDWYASYNPKKLTALMNSSQTKEVELTLPKFEMRCKMELNDSLNKMGIKKAFDEKKADLSLLGKSKYDNNLYLSFVLQEAVIRVGEEGTEAAAATIGGIAEATALMPDKPVVNFDRSFLYMIVDTESGVPLFMGVVDEP